MIGLLFWNLTQAGPYYSQKNLQNYTTVSLSTSNGSLMTTYENTLVENDTASVGMTTTRNKVETNTLMTTTTTAKQAQARVLNTTTLYYNYGTVTANSNSSSSLSTGAIVGIIIGVIVLLCCLGACGVKSGHWETRQVWVEY